MVTGPSDSLTSGDDPPESRVSARGWATRPLVPPTPTQPTDRVGPFPPDPDLTTAISSSARSLSPTSWLLLGTVAIVLAVTTFAIPAWTAARSSPRVVLLGSGSALSVLILSGDTRVVIAAGDDPAAFGTAFGGAIALAGGRIDLLIVGATGKELAVPADLAHGSDVRQVVRLGAPHPAAETGDLPDDLPQVPPLARIDVAPGLAATIETVEIPKPDEPGDFDLAWRAEIRYSAATVTVLSAAEDAGQFAPLDSRGVLVAASGDELGALLPSPAGALVVSAKDVDGGELRANLPPLLLADLPTVRVHSGTAVTLLLTEGGVELPANDVVVVRPLPETA